MTGRRSKSRWLTAAQTPVGALASFAALALTLVTVVGPALMSGPASELNPAAAGEGVSGEHWLGTDALGRDVLARVIVATRLSLDLAVGSTLVGVVVGVVVGSLPVVVGRRLGRLVGALINFSVAIPGLLLALFLAVVFGVGARSAMVALGLAFAPDFARLTHNLTTSVAGLDYVSAARILGVGRARLLARHVLPNVAEPLVISGTVAIGGALLTFSGLSFLGLGVQSPEYDWGRLLNEGLDRIYLNPASSLAPGVAIILAGLSFNLIGDALAHALGHRESHRARRRPADVGQHRDGWTSEPAAESGAVTDEAVLRVQDLRVLVPGPAGDTALVDGVTFEVGAGERIGVVGESGSGKSLTALAIAQLLQYPLQIESTELTFLGRDLRTAPSRATRHMLGTSLAIVFQDPSSAFNPTMRVGAQLAEVAQTHLHLDRRSAAEMAVDRLREVRLAAPAHRARQYPHELSGGMRQRAMVGMALMGSPKLLICDEPTTGLDVTIQAQVLDLLARVQHDSNAAVVFVSHDIAVVAGFCERVLVMYSGTIVEDLPVTELLARPAHPYTEALLSTVPAMLADREQPLATIAGRPPDPRDRPSGCAFSERCAYRTERCEGERPPLRSLGPEHSVACWHPIAQVPGHTPTNRGGPPL